MEAFFLSFCILIYIEDSQVSPVDGTVVRFGELKGNRGMIEQVKGHSYSVPALLGTNSLLPMVLEGKDESEEEEDVGDKGDRSWLRVSLASPKLRESGSARSVKNQPVSI